MVHTDLKQVDIRLATGKHFYADEPVKIRCQVHNDPSASMAVYSSHVHCFGCGFRIARRMEALAFLLHVDLSTAIKRAGEFIGQKKNERAPPKPVPLSPALIDIYSAFLFGERSNRLEWFINRGLTLETVKRFKLGHDGTRFVIPILNRKRELVTFRFRKDDWLAVEEDGRKYSGVRGRNETYLYPAWLLDLAFDTLVVCEGELDAVRLWQEGIPACSPTNGASSLQRIPELLASFRHISRLLIASDQDEAGEKGADELIQSASKYKCKRIKWDKSKGKDVTEWFNGEKKEIIRRSLS